MGNRKKIKDNRLRMKFGKPKFAEKGKLKNEEAVVDPRLAILDTTLARALIAEDPNNILTEEALLELGVIGPNDDPKIIKVVPAKANGIVIGDALIYDDGEIGVRYHKDAPEEGMKLVRETEKAYGYSLDQGRPFAIGEAGGPDGPPQED